MVKCRAFFLGKISRKIRGGEDVALEVPAEVGAPSRPGARGTLTVVWEDGEDAPARCRRKGRAESLSRGRVRRRVQNAGRGRVKIRAQDTSWWHARNRSYKICGPYARGTLCETPPGGG